MALMPTGPVVLGGDVASAPVEQLGTEPGGKGWSDGRGAFTSLPSRTTGRSPRWCRGSAADRPARWGEVAHREGPSTPSWRSKVSPSGSRLAAPQRTSNDRADRTAVAGGGTSPARRGSASPRSAIPAWAAPGRAMPAHQRPNALIPLLRLTHLATRPGCLRIVEGRGSAQPRVGPSHLAHADALAAAPPAQLPAVGGRRR